MTDETRKEIIKDDVELEMEDIIRLMSKDIPTWKLVLIDKLSDIKVFFWCLFHRKYLK